MFKVRRWKGEAVVSMLDLGVIKLKHGHRKGGVAHGVQSHGRLAASTIDSATNDDDRPVDVVHSPSGT